MVDLLPLVLVLVTGLAYGIAVRRLWRRHGTRSLPIVRVVSFGLGLLVIAGSLSGPLDAQAEERMAAHMVQHVLLVLVAAPLLVLGTPLSVLVRSLPARHRRRFTTPALRSRVARVVLAPLFAWTSFIVVLDGSHLPAIYDGAVAHEGWHVLEHVAYLATALLFWSMIVGLDFGVARASYPARLLYLFLAMAATAVLGEALATSDRPLYAYYATVDRAAGVSAVSDQHAAAVIMWLSGTFTIVPAMALVLLAWMNEDERRTRQHEARLVSPGHGLRPEPDKRPG